MNAADIALSLCVVPAELWSGLFTRSPRSCTRSPRAGRVGLCAGDAAVPAVARRSPTNWIIVIGLVVAPIAALIALRAGTAGFVLTALGLVACVAGPLLVSRFLAEPNYDVMLAWDPDAMAGELARDPAPVLPPELDSGRSDLDGIRAVCDRRYTTWA